MHNTPQMGCAVRIAPICKWRKQEIKELSHQVLCIVACCHSVKLCALAAQAL